LYSLANLDVYLRQRATWQRLPPEVREKLVEDTKKRIKKLLRESGLIPDQESRAPLEDREAAGYLDLEISGNEESEVEDVHSDPEAGEAVEAPTEELNGDA
jgi:hypothetical protein